MKNKILITPHQLATIKKLEVEEEELIDKSSTLFKLFVNSTVNTAFAILFYLPIIQHIALNILLKSFDVENNMSESTALSIFNFTETAERIAKELGWVVFLSLSRREPFHRAETITQYDSLRLELYKTIEQGLKKYSTIDDIPVPSNLWDLHPENIVKLMRSRTDDVYWYIVNTRIHSLLGLESIGKPILFLLEQTAFIALSKVITDPLSGRLFKHLRKSITSDKNVRKLNTTDADNQIKMQMKKNISLKKEVAWQEKVAWSICQLFAVYQIGKLITYQFISNELFDIIAAFASFRSGRNEIVVNESTVNETYTFNYFSIIFLFFFISITSNLLREKIENEKMRAIEGKFSHNISLIKEAIGHFANVSWCEQKENNLQLNYLTITITKQYKFLNMTETKHVIQDMLLECGFSVDSISKGVDLIVRPTKEIKSHSDQISIMRKTEETFESLNKLAELDHQIERICKIIAKGYNPVYDNQTKQYSIYLKENFDRFAISNSLEKFFPGCISTSSTENRIVISSSQPIAEAMLHECITFLSTPVSVDYSPPSSSSNYSSANFFQSTSITKKKNHKNNHGKHSHNKYDHKKHNHINQPKPQESIPIINEPPKRKEWEYRNKTYVYDSNDPHSMVKSVTGTCHQHYFFTSVMTEDMFAGNKNSYRKFNQFKEGPKMASSETGKEGIIDNKKNRRATSAAKIKFLGQNGTGDARVLLDLRTTKEGDFLFIAHKYVPHSHKRS